MFKKDRTPPGSPRTQIFRLTTQLSRCVIAARDGALPDEEVTGREAIALVIGTTLIPAARILKIKKYIGELGGTKKAVQLFRGAGFSYEKVKAAGGAFAALGAELIGISTIQKNCFE